MRYGLALLVMLGLGGCGGIEGSQPTSEAAAPAALQAEPASAQTAGSGPLNSPCHLDGEGNSCVRGADLCRARGGTVYRGLSCNDPNLVCCFL